MQQILSNWAVEGEIKELPEGSKSQDWLVETGDRRYVLRRVLLPEEVLNDGSRVHNYLYEVGLNVPASIMTREKKFWVSHEGSTYVLQTFIEGSEDIDTKTFFQNLTGFTQLFGVLHRTLYEADKRTWKITREGFTDPDALLKEIMNVNPMWLQLPQDEEIRTQFETWKDDYKHLPRKKLTKGVIHGNLGPRANILHMDGQISGFTNFFGAHFGYYLYDLATFMMFANLYHKEVEKVTRGFLLTYLDTAPVRRKEIKHLRFFLKTRAFLQIMLFSKRIHDGNTQGVSDNGDNIKGYEEGVSFLNRVNEIPEDHYWHLIEDSYSII